MAQLLIHAEPGDVITAADWKAFLEFAGKYLHAPAGK